MSMQSNNDKGTKVIFKKTEYDLVWNRDYSIVEGRFSVNTLAIRIKVPAQIDSMEHFF